MSFSNSFMQVYSLINLSNVNISISTEKASKGQLIIYNVNGKRVFEQPVFK
ncbi:MAG: hypothetical protein H7098_02590 [Oligoflexus sp.]|nr:hypothetical protein [Pseudopedobacter sp.]